MYTRIKEILDESGLNQQEFAERIAIAPATLSNILKGRQAKYNTDLVMSIAAQFPEINPLWLMSGKGDKYQSKSGGAGDPGSSNIGDGTVDAEDAALGQSGNASGLDESLFGGLSDGSFYPGARIEYNSPGLNNGPENASGKNGASGQPVNGNRSQVGGANRQAGLNPGFIPPTNPKTGKPMTPSEINQLMSYFSGGFGAVNPAVLAAKNMDIHTRKIREIRVYYDDDTFEVFSPSKG